MAVSSQMVPLGSPVPEFSLPSLDGAQVDSAALTGAPALLVMFLSNHCPYVRHIEGALGSVVAEYAERGVAAVAICSNDTNTHPDDGAAGMAEQARRAGFGFPYVVDESQQVAHEFRAACTPDFFLYDGSGQLAYRGEFDESRPRNDTAVTGEVLRTAMDRVLAGEPVPEPHVPSMGCGIKWKPGNEPA
ncbi:MAG: redoxin domain-containing protein [Pseudonocardiaceae bacterium]|nr:redoxin domain-containing protein [Pseudonocardiaceae bacterium]